MEPSGVRFPMLAEKNNGNLTLCSLWQIGDVISLKYPLSWRYLQMNPSRRSKVRSTLLSISGMHRPKFLGSLLTKAWASDKLRLMIGQMVHILNTFQHLVAYIAAVLDINEAGIILMPVADHFPEFPCLQIQCMLSLIWDNSVNCSGQNKNLLQSYMTRLLGNQFS